MLERIKSRDLLLLSLLIMVLAVMFTGCQSPETEAKEPIKIGALFAVTGPASPLGVPEKETAELIQEMINETGGINGRPVQIIIHDTKSQETDTLMAVKRLIDDGVVAIVGPSQTGTSLAALDTVTRAGVPMVSCAAGVAIVEPVEERHWIFKTAQSDVHAVAKLIDYMKDNNINSVAMISVSNAFGDSGKQQLKKQAEAANIKIVAEEIFGDKDTDMTAQLTRIRGRNPEAVVCWGTNPGPAIVARNMRQLGIDKPLLMSHGIANMKFIELAGDAANGVIFPAGRLIVVDEIEDEDPQKATLIQFRDAFRAKFDKEPDTFGGHAWDAIHLVIDAIREVGDDKAAIRDYIANAQNFVGIGGVFNFSPQDHNGLTKDAFVIVTIKDGKWSLVN